MNNVAWNRYMNSIAPTGPPLSPAGRALASWLTEFGYMHAAGGDVRVAFRMALIERGADRLRRELACHT